jgi:ABC-type nitrate/sulfonate/bicarbonate transport system substrate-binding protein
LKGVALRIFIFILILLSCTRDQITLKIGIIAPAFNYLPLKIAEEKEYLKELEYELIRFNSGWELGEALIANKVDVAIIPFTYCLQAQAKGIKIQIISCLEHEDDGIIVRKGIENLSDLKGKSIGCLKASTLELLLQRFLEEKSITGTKIVYFTSPMEMWAALEKGEVDALSYYVPGIIKADNKIGKIIHWYGADWKMHPCCDIAGEEGLIKKKNSQIKELLDAITMGIKVIEQDTAYAISIAKKSYGLDEDIALESIRKTPFRLSLTQDEMNFHADIADRMFKKGYLNIPINSELLYAKGILELEK